MNIALFPGTFTPKEKAKMQQKNEFTKKHLKLRARNLHQARKFYTSAAGDACDIQKVCVYTVLGGDPVF